MLPIDTVAVMGATDAGTLCVVLAALSGCMVRLHDASDRALERAFEALRRRVELAIAAGALTRTERQRVLDGVLFTPDLAEALTGADLVVVAGPAEPPDVALLAETLRATTAIAAAGATPPDELAARLPQPGRVLALRLAESHGPVPRLEILPATATSEHVLERARDFAARANRAARVALPPAAVRERREGSAGGPP